MCRACFAYARHALFQLQTVCVSIGRAASLNWLSPLRMQLKLKNTANSALTGYTHMCCTTKPTSYRIRLSHCQTSGHLMTAAAAVLAVVLVQSFVGQAVY